MLPARANTQPAFGACLGDPTRPVAMPAGLIVLAIARDRIHAITRFHTDALYPRSGLPESLPEPAAPPRPDTRRRPGALGYDRR
ncbi:hypothetical protein GTS_33950 [Gandjariella thermophila]|uniref:Uncharacterized protein n=1 Tax=Gandjariella thermophila TaxID=1931992 RepID=A0A4D4J948_9PSEU|nr:hypothetical protein GTS_33950 [Gandjariella thermophila]